MFYVPIQPQIQNRHTKQTYNLGLSLFKVYRPKGRNTFQVSKRGERVKMPLLFIEFATVTRRGGRATGLAPQLISTPSLLTQPMKGCTTPLGFTPPFGVRLKANSSKGTVSIYNFQNSFLLPNDYPRHICSQLLLVLYQFQRNGLQFAQRTLLYKASRST